MSLRIPDNFLGRKVEGAMERVLAGSKTPTAQPTTPSPITQNSDEFWRIPQVEYRNGIYVVDLSKKLLDNGTAKTQDDWAKYSLESKPRGDFYVGDMPLYHSVFRALFKRKGQQDAEEARKFIQEQMRARWLMTLTRIAYQQKGKDRVIHDFGTNQTYLINESIVGPDKVIEQEDSSALTALLGTGDINETKGVYNWINQTPTYIWRVNSKPKQVDERVARFVAGSGRAYLDCDRDPADSDSSLGVRIVREAPQKT
jgi:hypothetical protein